MVAIIIHTKQGDDRQISLFCQIKLYGRDSIYSRDPLVHDPLVHGIAYSTVTGWLPFSGGRIVYYTTKSLVARPCTKGKSSIDKTVFYMAIL